MKDLSEFELLVLGAASDDYEAPHTIANNLAQHLGHEVSEQAVSATFVRLSQLGLVQAFQFCSASQKFQPVTAETLAAVGEPWFLSKAHSTLTSLSNISSKPTP